MEEVVMIFCGGFFDVRLRLLFLMFVQLCECVFEELDGFFVGVVFFYVGQVCFVWFCFCQCWRVFFVVFGGEIVLWVVDDFWDFFFGQVGGEVVYCFVVEFILV